ncbi:MAG: hypothetical protein ACO36I_13805 [Candidatus Latescibacterota bacterium]
MDTANLIGALRQTARRLDGGARYEWGHMGRCNCGHLVQTLTDMTDYEIVKSIDFQYDEWTEHAKDYCEGTGQRVDDLFDTLKGMGLSHKDVMHLEYLSDKRVLERLDGGLRYLQKNRVEDVTEYMNTWADMLEEDSKGVLA